MSSKARAYAEQARADFDAYVASGESDERVLGEHHRLQLLQMAVEKACKAYLYHAEPNGRYSHHVALAAINSLRSHAIAEAAGMNFSVFVRLLHAAKPILLLIEAASPSVGFDGRGLTRDESERTANVEYPWQTDQDDAASWVAPASQSFSIVRNLRYDRRSVAAVGLLDRVIDAALTLFN